MHLRPLKSFQIKLQKHRAFDISKGRNSILTRPDGHLHVFHRGKKKTTKKKNRTRAFLRLCELSLSALLEKGLHSNSRLKGEHTRATRRLPSPPPPAPPLRSVWANPLPHPRMRSHLWPLTPPRPLTPALECLTNRKQPSPTLTTNPPPHHTTSPLVLSIATRVLWTY